MKITKSDTLLNTVGLEARLIARNRYARYMTITGPCILFILVIPLMMLPIPAAEKAPLAFIAGTLFPLTYVMFVFGWNSEHADGLFVLPLDAKQQVIGRIIVSVLLGIIPSCVMSILLALVEPELALLPIAGYSVSVGTVSIPLVIFSLYAPQRIELNVGAFAKIQTLNWRHQLVGFVLLAVLALLPNLIPPTLLAILGIVVGIVGLAVLPLSARMAASVLQSRIPELSERYRRT